MYVCMCVIYSFNHILNKDAQQFRERLGFTDLIASMKNKFLTVSQSWVWTLAFYAYQEYGVYVLIIRYKENYSF